MLNLENDNKLMELRTRLERDEMTSRNNNEVKDIDTNRVNQLIGNYHNNKLNNYSNTKTVHSNSSMYGNKTNIDLKDIKRGDILYVDLDQSGFGSEQFGIRYSICIQNNIGNKFSPTIIVAFITSQMTKSKLPTHVHIEAGNFGLPKDSVVLMEQVRTLDKRRIIKKVGSVDELTLKKINVALSISLGDMEEKTEFEKLPKWIREAITRKIENIHTFERALLNCRNKNEVFRDMCLRERQLCLEDLEDFCIDNKLNYRDYYTKYIEMDEVNRNVI